MIICKGYLIVMSYYCVEKLRKPTALLLSNYRQVTLETQLVNIVTMAFSRY